MNSAPLPFIFEAADLIYWLVSQYLAKIYPLTDFQISIER